MILAPASSPPTRSPGAGSALKDTTSHNIPPAPVSSICQAATKCAKYEENEEGLAFLNGLNVPTVILDAPSVSHTMAASLSLSLLGHTLFLKSQVPFPVAQLMRMPGGGSNPKVAKKREDLLATFDTLSSHLQTTFVALSTAYAKCKLAKEKTTTVPGDENSQKNSDISAVSGAPQRGAAHLMFVLGPSVGAARARILLTIDGLDVKVWGERADVPPPQAAAHESEDEGSVDLEDSDEEEEEDIGESEEDGEESEEADSEEDSSDSCDEESSEEEDELDELESDASTPPASRSPSPSLARSLAPSPESVASPNTLTKPLPMPHGENAAAPISVPPAPTVAPASAPAPASCHPSPAPSQPPAPSLSYAEEQAALRAAERLLSRTLMNAWADGGGDMASELAPTQTHVLLRAPRRFAHPAWVARQNLTRTLDGVLDGFLADAGALGEAERKKGAKKSRGVRTEGAWIGSRGGSAFAAARARKAAEGSQEDDTGEVPEGDEEDEEIWWAWEGKIVGFADW